MQDLFSITGNFFNFSVAADKNERLLRKKHTVGIGKNFKTIITGPPC